MDNKIAQLLTEQINSRTTNIDDLSVMEIVRLINAEDQSVALAVERELANIAKAINAVVAAFKNGGRLIYMGAGTSGRLAVVDAVECVPTFGVEPGLVVGLIAGGNAALSEAVEGAEDDRGAGIEQLKALGLNSRDIVVGIAASGRTPYVVAGLEYANSLGAFTVAISCTPGSIIAQIAKLAINLLVGPEVITGSTRMKAGTATKMVLNMISTAAMICCGKVYGNLMVDVKPTNLKLRNRAQRIVMAAANVTAEQAVAALKTAGFNPKAAIVMLKCGCTIEEAKNGLAEAGGFISKAINKLEKGKG